MENKEAMSSFERVLFTILAISMLVFFGWLDIASNFEEIGPATIIILSVSGGVFLIALIIYMVPYLKARKARHRDFYNSINNQHYDIFDYYDKDPFEEFDKNIFDSDKTDEEK